MPARVHVFVREFLYTLLICPFFVLVFAVFFFFFLFLEGIEMFKDDWHDVASHVGSGKTAEMCIQKFIQLPIQEPFGHASLSSPPGRKRYPLLLPRLLLSLFLLSLPSSSRSSLPDASRTCRRPKYKLMYIYIYIYISQERKRDRQIGRWVADT